MVIDLQIFLGINKINMLESDESNVYVVSLGKWINEYFKSM